MVGWCPRNLCPCTAVDLAGMMFFERAQSTTSLTSQRARASHACDRHRIAGDDGAAAGTQHGACSQQADRPQERRHGWTACASSCGVMRLQRRCVYKAMCWAVGGLANAGYHLQSYSNGINRATLIDQRRRKIPARLQCNNSTEHRVHHTCCFLVISVCQCQMTAGPAMNGTRSGTVQVEQQRTSALVLPVPKPKPPPRILPC